MQKQVFDHVAAGGRTSDSIIATRVAEDPTIAVYLVRAGTPNGGNDQVLLATKLLAVRGSKPNYNCEIESQLRVDAVIRFADAQPYQNTSARRFRPLGTDCNGQRKG
jgi:hypothetical protein